MLILLNCLATDQSLNKKQYLIMKDTQLIKVKMIFCLQLLFFSLISCNKKNNTLIYSLHKAGNNKQELEKVLDFYKSNPADSLKYKAAVFLIENMPNHSFRKPVEGFQSAFDSIENYPKDSKRRDVFEKILDSVSKTVVSKDSKEILDIEYLTSDFLINNIELAFKAWERIPKDKRASFDDFCNFILPYRNSDEPLEKNSREKLFKKYAWVHELLDKGASLKTVVDSVTSGFDYINLPKIRNYYPVALTMSQIEKAKFGLCDDGVNYYVNVFRALGIVSAKEMVTHWGSHPSSGHSWIYTKYGKEEYATDVGGGHEDLKIKLKEESIPKVLRLTYKNQKNLFPVPLAIDVTNEYVPTVNLTVKNKLQKSILQPVISVFDKSQEWSIVSFGTYEKGILHYPNMGINVVYIAASIDNNNFHPVNYPFYIDNRKQIHYFKPTKKNIDSVGLTRKIGLSTPRNRTKIDWIQNLNGGLFEGANNPEFNNSKIIYQISNLNSVQLQKIKINSTEKFKYVRFNANGKEAFLSSLFFYGQKGQKLDGEVFEKCSFIKDWGKGTGAFDDNLYTYSGGKDFFIGLKFSEPKSIGSIEFQARNDENHIIKGEEYELFYWDKKWKSLGIQIAQDTVIYYNTPENSLLWLKNNTRGNEEHVFFINRNIKQYWPSFDN